MERLKRWLARYGLSEVAGTVGALAGYNLALHLAHNEVVAAYCGAMGENAGFYGVALLREVRATRRQQAKSNWWTVLRRVVPAMLLEFGPAELLDSCITRPLALGLGAHYVGDVWGTLLGKILADVVFYIPVVATYELRRRR